MDSASCNKVLDQITLHHILSHHHILPGGVDAIKLEGGKAMAPRVKAMVDNGIPVMGHIGLTPQTSSSLGGMRVQGRTADSALKLLDDALALQEAGCFAVVLETVPREIAAHITSVLRIPTIGIGAGAGTSGQVLVAHDMLGMFDVLQPKFVKRYAHLGPQMQAAIKAYHEDVVARTFPSQEHTFTINAEQMQAYMDRARPILDQHGLRPAPTPVVKAIPTPEPAPWFRRATTPFVTPAFPIKKVAVIGGGSMGSLVAAALSSNPATCEVTLVSNWAEHVKKINEDGLQLSLEGAPIESAHFPATLEKAAPVVFARQKADLAIILVKAGQMAQAIELVYDMVRPGGAVLTLQNGMGYQDQLLNLQHVYHLFRGITFNGASVTSPGVLHINGRGQSVIAPFNPASYESDFQSSDTFQHNDLDVCTSIGALFNHFGFETVAFPDNNSVFEKILWEKVAVNSVVNPLTAIFNVRNGDLLQHPVCKHFIPLLVDEICDVFQNALLLDITRDVVTQRVIATCSQTAKNVSSMLADVRRQVPTEIEFMNGQIVKHGIENNIDVPMNAVIVDTIREIESTFAAPKSPIASMGHLDSNARDLISQMRSAALSQRRKYSTAARSVVVASDVEAVRTFRQSLRHGTTLGFVPTMGALHTGHIELVRQAKQQCDKVAVSIFVNPTQFAAHEDLSAYPRTLERDLQLLSTVGVDLVFAPRDASVMYPPGFKLSVDVPDAHLKKEGAVRPGHFGGVATVCLKLFNIVQPTSVYFGQKDAQQCATIKTLVRDFNVPTHVVICPTMRAEDGLALSSRNAYLSPEERAASVILYKTLTEMERLCRGGLHSADALRQAGSGVLGSHPLSAPQYISVAELDTMDEIEGVITAEQLRKGVCFSLASKVGKVRLIDNFPVFIQ